ncbi:hypothetical protein ACFPK9_00570 [Rubritalea spongiae]|uniref:Uncharacterized protein n=1 Tax=Rubritalea spongiae TaxID=430797 RepID=A0ABW5E588_9BACT
MHTSYQSVFKTPVRHRIIEKRTKILEGFVRNFSAKKLLSVECAPLRTSDRKRCFVNVERHIEKHGGSMISGWIFNEYENRYIEGEAHAIWMDRFQKKKLDITPHDHQPRRVLFLPDPHVAKKRGYTLSPKHLLTDDPYIIGIVKFEAEIDRIFEDQFESFGKPMTINREHIDHALEVSGIPEEVGQHLLSVRQTGEMNMWDHYGNS